MVKTLKTWTQYCLKFIFLLVKMCLSYDYK